MATTTPNFGWSVPTSTDLVKDGATAIETLGDSIDASFVDLKGGTTGQVLSKASGTDLDFTWVAQDDSNAIQNAIVDAKGDLIAATAADTPARLAVGTNGQVLTADSTAATGLVWATPSSGATWTNFTPTYTNVTVGNGTVIARYQKTGNLVTVYYRLTFGTTTSITGSNPVVILPSPIVPLYRFAMTGVFFDTGVQAYLGAFTTDGANVNCEGINTASTWANYGGGIPFTMGNLDFFYFSGTYEVA
jgi:hypothetical protein